MCGEPHKLHPFSLLDAYYDFRERMETDSEARESLLVAAKNGDREAFGGMVRATQSMVFGIAWNSVRDTAVAEELAQEVYLELHQKLGTIESWAHLIYWLRRVASHRCIDSSRRRKSRPTVELDSVMEPAVEAGGEDPLLTGLLRKLTASLPERSRAVMILRFQEDMELNEIARTLEIPLNTVKSQLHRSLAMLRDKLERAKVRA